MASVSYTFGEIYPRSYFSSFSTTLHDFLILQMNGNTPEIKFQPRKTNTIFSRAFIPGDMPIGVYVLPVGDTYRIIAPIEGANIVVIYATPEYRKWLLNEKIKVHNLPNFTFSSGQSTALKANQLVVVLPRAVNPNNHVYKYIPYQLNWLLPSDKADYLSTDSYRFFFNNQQTPWFNDEFITALKTTINSTPTTELVIQSVLIETIKAVTPTTLQTRTVENKTTTIGAKARSSFSTKATYLGEFPSASSEENKILEAYPIQSKSIYNEPVGIIFSFYTSVYLVFFFIFLLSIIIYFIYQYLPSSK